MELTADFADATPVLKAGPPKEMLGVSLLPDGRTKVRVNSSSLSLMQECWRKTNLVLNEGWRSQVESPATVFGSAIHRALEIFYRGEKHERTFPHNWKEASEGMAYGQTYSDEEGFLLLRALRGFISVAAPLAALPETDKRSIQNGVYLLENYFRTYIDDPYVVYVDERGPFVERDFSFVLYEDKFHVVEYFGRVDLALTNPSTGQVLITDHKTTSVIGNDFYTRVKPNHQYTGYLLGAREAFGLKTDSFLVNGLQVKEKPKTSRGTPPHLVRQITTRDEDDFAEFRETVLEFVFQFLENRELGKWALGPANACASYGACQFLQVCASPKSLRPNILAAKFTQQTKGTSCQL